MAPAPPAAANPAAPPAAVPAAVSADWSRTAADIERQTHWRVTAIRRSGRALQVQLQGPYGAYLGERLDRAIAVAHRDAPVDIERFVFSFEQDGIALTDWVVLRRAWFESRTRYAPLQDAGSIQAQVEPRGDFDGEPLFGPRLPGIGGGLDPSYSQVVGGPNGFVLFAAGVDASIDAHLGQGTSVHARGNLRVLDNYSRFTYDGPSLLPRVRTYLREYLTTARATLPELQLTHVQAVSRDQSVSLYAGLLESMFAGVGGEWLARPWQGPVAFGVDINRVRQRGFAQNFTLRDYRVTTGHATLYWDTGWNAIRAKLSVGQYLAGDKGATLDIARRFANGTEFGAYATRTNVSTAQFGEGSFDKGIYIRMPFDAFLMGSSNASARFLWNPLTRDGGARLDRAVQLYDLTAPRDPRAAWVHSARMGADGQDSDLGLAELAGELGHSAHALGGELFTAGGAQAMLWGTAAVATAALLDKPIDRWALRHQGGRWDKVGKAAGELPLALALGTSLAWIQRNDGALAHTAQTALLATAFTVTAEEGLRLAVDRSRPNQGQGPWQFGGGSQARTTSGFPSLHAGAAFALATPFAQQYSAPWLYALAAAAGAGRIQQRDHYVSDVVAGSLIGYGVATILQDHARSTGAYPVIGLAGKNIVSATWRF